MEALPRHPFHPLGPGSAHCARPSPQNLAWRTTFVLGQVCVFLHLRLIARARRGWGDAGRQAAPCRAPAVLLHVPRRSVYATLTYRAARLSALSRRSWRLRSPDPAAAHGSHPRGAASGRRPPGPGAPLRNGCGRCLAESRPTAVSRVPPSPNTHTSTEEQAHPWRRASPAPRAAEPAIAIVACSSPSHRGKIRRFVGAHNKTLQLYSLELRG